MCQALRQIAIEYVEIELARRLARRQVAEDPADRLAQPSGPHQHTVRAVLIAFGSGTQPGGVFGGYEVCLIRESEQISVGVEVIPTEGECVGEVEASATRIELEDVVAGCLNGLVRHVCLLAPQV
ncbi:MAG: hypothetical protein E6I52_17925 [Chloroflexi bacterium]|nr:MAG: hypothetical protein E6I52_17925 [Chloroflexota bacterium]